MKTQVLQHELLSAPDPNQLFGTGPGSTTLPLNIQDDLSPKYSQNITEWDTGVDPAVLKYVGMKSVQVSPANFNVHQHLFKHHVEVSQQQLL